jgi:cytochrome c
MIPRRLRKTGITLVAVALTGAALATSATADHVPGATPRDPGHVARLVFPIMSPERGKVLFVNKGCVACHAVNGVGGHDAPNMDAHSRMEMVNPFDFAARMWNHAPAMIASQEGAFGEQVYFTGQELADIIAFVHDDDAQHTFTEDELTPRARKMMDHDHGATPATKAHAKELGHDHAPGTPPHKD